ncbi:MAG: hypothetical protein AAF614_06965 [Chloroflexota bacterium]
MKKLILLMLVLIITACGGVEQAANLGRDSEASVIEEAKQSALTCFTLAFGLVSNGNEHAVRPDAILQIGADRIRNIKLNNVRGNSDPQQLQQVGHSPDTLWAGIVYHDFEMPNNSGEWISGSTHQSHMRVTETEIIHTSPNQGWCTHLRGQEIAPPYTTNWIPEATMVPIEEPPQNATVEIVQEEVQESGFVESETLLEEQGVPTAAWDELQEPPTAPWAYVSPPQHGQEALSQENLALLYGAWDFDDLYNFIVFHTSGVMVSAGGAFLFTVNGDTITFDSVDNNSPDSFTQEIESISQTSLTLGGWEYEKVANSAPLTPENYGALIVGKWGDKGYFEDGQRAISWFFGNDGKYSYITEDEQGQVGYTEDGNYRVSGEGFFLNEQRYLAIMIMDELMIRRDIDDPTYTLYRRVHE